MRATVTPLDANPSRDVPQADGDQRQLMTACVS